jgi:hypothetical protein
MTRAKWIAAFFVIAMLAQAQEEKQTGVAGLAWMAGTWRMEDEGSLWEDHWSAPRGDSIVGISRWIRQGKAALYELFVIEEAAGTLHLRMRHFNRGLEPWKSEAKGPLSWPLKSAAKNEVIFEEASRDFPKRMVYRRPEKDVLVVRLEGISGGKEAAQEFRFKRAGD